MTSGAWLGSMTPPAPSRMREVTAVSRASISCGEPAAAPGIPWCSDIQKRSKPFRSASSASATISAKDSRAESPTPV